MNTARINSKALPARENFGTFDLIFGADVIYLKPLAEPFVKALAWAVSGSGAVNILVAHKMRTTCNLVCDLTTIADFERSAKREGLGIVEAVRTGEALLAEGSAKVFVYHLQKL